MLVLVHLRKLKRRLFDVHLLERQKNYHNDQPNICNLWLIYARHFIEDKKINVGLCQREKSFSMLICKSAAGLKDAKEGKQAHCLFFWTGNEV